MGRVAYVVCFLCSFPVTQNVANEAIDRSEDRHEVRGALSMHMACWRGKGSWRGGGRCNARGCAGYALVELWKGRGRGEVRLFRASERQRPVSLLQRS